MKFGKRRKTHTLIFTIALISLMCIGNSYGQALPQTPPNYLVSKAYLTNDSNQVIQDTVTAEFIAAGVSPNDYDTFVWDVDRPVAADTDSPNGPEGFAGPVFRNVHVTGSGPQTDIRGLQAALLQYEFTNPACPNFYPVFATNNLLVDNATLSLEEYSTECIETLNSIRHSAPDLLATNSITLNNGHLVAPQAYSVLRLGSDPNSVNVEVSGTDNFYAMHTVTPNPPIVQLSLNLQPNAKLRVGDAINFANLESNPNYFTRSSLTMQSGSALSVKNAYIALVGAASGAGAEAGYPESSLTGADLAIDHGGVGNSTRVSLSVLNVTDSNISITAAKAYLRASRFLFSGNNMVEALGVQSLKPALSWEKLEEPVRALSMEVGNGTTRLMCAPNSCDSVKKFLIATQQLDVGSGGTLEIHDGVDLMEDQLELIKVLSGGALVADTNAISVFRGNNQLQELLLQPGSKLTMKRPFELGFKDGAVAFLEGRVDFDPVALASEVGQLTIKPNRDISTHFAQAEIHSRLNPAGWTKSLGPGIPDLEYHADYLNISPPTIADGDLKIVDFDKAEIVLEAGQPGLSAADYVTGGFNDPDHGLGTYNIVVTPDPTNVLNGKDRPQAVTFGPSMPAGLVAQVTRGLDDDPIYYQPNFPSVKEHVLQVKLSLAAGPFAVSYPTPVITNEGDLTVVQPTISNAAGTVTVEFVDITPTDGGAAYQGSVSYAGSTAALSLTPAAGDGGDCSVSTANARTFDVLAVVGRSGLPDQDVQVVAKFELQVCDSQSAVSPYISYPNILDSEIVPVGSAISKKPTVFGFTPTGFAVASGSTLPDGLNLDAVTGEISGVPVKAANGADASFTIEATDGVTTVLDPVTLVIDPTISYASEKTEIGQPFTSAVPATSPYNGIENPVFRLVNPPSGWTIDASGVVSATPDAFGEVVLTVEYEAGPLGSAAGNVATAILHVTVDGDPIKIEYPLNSYSIGEAVSLTPTLTNDRGAVTYSVSQSALPVGWSLDTATGIVTGTMPKSGEPSFFITATDPYTSGSTNAKVLRTAPVTQTVTGGPAGLSASLSVQGCSAIASAAFVTPPDTPSKPKNFDFPFDLLDFTLTGCNSLTNGVVVTIDYSQAIPAGAEFFKEENGQYFRFGAYLGTNTATFGMTDNGFGDDDSTVGTIHDPSGIAVARNAGPTIPVPVLTGAWLWWMLALMAASGGVVLLRREKV